MLQSPTQDHAEKVQQNSAGIRHGSTPAASQGAHVAQQQVLELATTHAPEFVNQSEVAFTLVREKYVPGQPTRRASRANTAR